MANPLTVTGGAAALAESLALAAFAKALAPHLAPLLAPLIAAELGVPTLPLSPAANDARDDGVSDELLERLNLERVANK